MQQRMVRTMVVVIAMSVGCRSTGTFDCAQDQHCRRGGEVGVCTDGYCGFVDGICPSGYRYDELAGGGLAGECVPTSGIDDASVDGTDAPDVAVDAQPLGCMVAMSAGGTHACVRRDDSTLRCWGRNVEGELTSALASPQEMPAAVTDPTGVAAIATGDRHTCARLANGDARCWGLNTQGQLGNNSQSNSPTPVAPMNLGTIAAIDGGAEFTCAIASADGGVYCWGRNNEGQIGDTTVNTTPTLVPVRVQKSTGGDLVGASKITLGWRHACALASGNVYCWGQGTFGKLGIGSAPATQPSAIAVPGLSSIKAIAAGRDHTCAIETGSEANVYCWGKDDQAQVGNGSLSSADVLSPVQLDNTPEDTALAIDAGDNHTCVLFGGSALYCWGRNAEGQIDDPAVARIYSPKLITDFGAPNVMATGSNFTCAIIGTAVWCRGYNNDAQLGVGPADGTAVPHPTPVQLSLTCP